MWEGDTTVYAMRSARTKGGRCHRGLTVGSGDDDLEVLAPLASVCRKNLGHWASPKRT